jgi:hypothetical protein
VKPVAAAVFAALATTALPALGSGDLTLLGGARVEYHDNISRQADNEDSDVDRVARIDLGYQRDQDGLLVDLDYDAEYHDYLHDREEDETVLNGRANLVWELLPRQLDFVLNHQVNQLLSDRQGVDVSGNRELRSVLTTGVDWTTAFSPVTSLIITPRYIDVRFEESDSADSQHGVLGAALRRQLSRVSSLTLSGSYSDVQFDDGLNDYRASVLMVTYATQLSRLSYEVGIGANQFDRDSGDDVDGYVVRMSARHASGASAWTAALVHELTDNAIGLSGQELALDGFVADDGNFAQIDIVERTQLDLGFEHSFSAASSIVLGVGARNDDYDSTLQDEEGYYASAAWRYVLNSRWSFAASARYEETEFTDDPADLKYEDTLYSLTADYRFSSALTTQFAVIREERDASESDLSYTDNIVLVSINYQFF